MKTMDDSFDILKEECVKCTRCPLCQTRKNVVFGSGDYKNRVMVIGEAPGASEDEQGLPFVGRSGKLLTEMMSEAGIKRENVFITNTVKCRPPQNRDPKSNERLLCSHWLDEQIRIMKPKVIVCVGRIACSNFIDKGFKVTVQHGKPIEKDGIIYVGTYHPAAILRNIHNKPFAINDWKKIKSIFLMD